MRDRELLPRMKFIPFHQSGNRLRFSAGFTLIEVAIALGIFAFAIIPIIGLMGTGLKVSKESIDDTTTAQIFRVAEATLSANAATSATNFYFSNEGTLTNSSEAIFRAIVDPVTPSDAAQGLLVRRMWQVRIVNPAATNVVYSERSIQVSRDISTSDF